MTSSPDRRIRVAHLADAGHRERETLDERANELARSVLAPLSSQQRERLVAAMRDVERAGVSSRAAGELWRNPVLAI